MDDIGHALSIIVQQRYVWLLNHVTRAIVLSIMDGPPRPELVPRLYQFSEEEEQKGATPLSVTRILNPLARHAKPFASGDHGDVFDGAWTRELTIVGLRMGVLLTVQAYLELHRVERILKQSHPPQAELFSFIRQARNVLAHAGARMDSPRLVRTTWRDKIIERNGETFSMTDREIDLLIQDAVEVMVTVFVAGGRQLGFVTLNLGFEIPCIRRYIDERGLGS